MSWGLREQIKELRETLEKIHKLADTGSEWVVQRRRSEQTRNAIRTLARQALDKRT